MDARAEELVNQLGMAAARTAMRACADYARSRRDGGKVLHAEAESVCALLREEIEGALDSAMKDAREAVEAGMDQVASATFVASMVLAGQRAAKRFLAGERVAS